MEFKESLEIVLRDCKFVLNSVDLARLMPGIGDFIPPFSAIRFSDTEAPRFIWGLPVVHGRRLLWVLHQFITRETMKCVASPTYQENLRLLTPAELREDVYFQVLSDFLLKTLAEGSFLKLDSVLWLYLCDVVNRRLNQDEVIDRILVAQNPNEYSKLNNLDPEMARLRLKDPRRYAEIRVKVLRSLFARNDFANSSMKDVFDEVPNNPLNREMIANRLIYTERPDSLYRSLDVNEAFLVKGYKFTATDFTGINRALRMIISGMLARAGSGRPLPLDVYFLKTFLTDDVRMKVPGIPSQGTGLLERNASPREVAEAEEREKLAYVLALQEEPTRYLLHHLDLEDKEYFRPIERNGTIPKEIVKALRYRASAVIFEGLYNEVTRDLLRWDFFHTLKSRLRWVIRRGDIFFCDDRPLSRSLVPLNLDSYYEIYRRSRYGTAVFFDLIGFTNRTKALTRELQEAASRGDKERYDLSSISLAIQRVFAVRNNLDHFGGIPQGFEGDAILDMFPKALDALRYVTTFVDNYTKNRLIRFRPFERPTENPYKEGFRVGLASGDYSVISIVGRSNDLAGEKSTDRAVGHTINRASRLNSGKKGDKLFLVEDEEELHEVLDPLNLFKVRITAKKELINSGIASFEDTFLEIRDQVRAEQLPWYEPTSLRGGRVAGVVPVFQNYDFELIFEEPRMQKIYLVRKLEGAPELKGLEDEQIVIYEYLLMEIPRFLEVLRLDAELGRPSRLTLPAGELDGREEPPAIESVEGGLSLTDGPSSFSWQDMVDDEVAELQKRYGIGMDELRQGEESARAALHRHNAALETWAEGQADPAPPVAPSPVPPAPWELEEAEADDGLGPWLEVEPEAKELALKFLSDVGSEEEGVALRTSELPMDRSQFLPGVDAITAADLEATAEEGGGDMIAAPPFAFDFSGDSSIEWQVEEEEAPDTAPEVVERVPIVAEADEIFELNPASEVPEPQFLENDVTDGFVLDRIRQPAPVEGPSYYLGDASSVEIEWEEAVDAPTEEQVIPRAGEGVTHLAGLGIASSGGRPQLEVIAAGAGFPRPWERALEGSGSDPAELGGAQPGASEPAVRNLIALDWRGVPEVRELLEELVLERGRGLDRQSPDGTPGDSRETPGQAGSGVGTARQDDTGIGSYRVSRGNIVEHVGRQTSPRGRESDVSGGGSLIPDFALLFQDYVYGLHAPASAAGAARLVIGQLSGERLEDVRVYELETPNVQPWSLDRIFLRYLEEGRRTGFERSGGTWQLSQGRLRWLCPVPIVQLERLYRMLITRSSR